MLNEQELRNQIIEKAWTDPTFKTELLANPKAAIKEAFGVSIPDEIKLDVLEETKETHYLVIPQNPSDVNSDNIEGPRWA